MPTVGTEGSNMPVYKKPIFDDQKKQQCLVLGHINGIAVLEDTITGEKCFAMLDEYQAPVGTFVESELKHPLEDLPVSVFNEVRERF